MATNIFSLVLKNEMTPKICYAEPTGTANCMYIYTEKLTISTLSIYILFLSYMPQSSVNKL